MLPIISGTTTKQNRILCYSYPSLCGLVPSSPTSHLCTRSPSVQNHWICASLCQKKVPLLICTHPHTLPVIMLAHKFSHSLSHTHVHCSSVDPSVFLSLTPSFTPSLFVSLFLSSKNIFFYFMFTWDAPRLHSLDSSWTWQSLILSNTRGYAIVLCIQEPYLPWNFFWKPKQNWLVTFLSVSPVGLDVLTLLLLHVIHWLLPHYNPLIAETVVFSTLYSLSLVVCSF